MTIVWRDGLSVGNEVIDNDHKRLIGIINSAERVINESGSRRELERILAALDQYAHEHFAREEQVQRAIGYPSRDTHKLEHKALVRRLQQIRDRVGAAKDSYAYEQVLSGLCELLENWLMTHVITHDLRMRPYIEKTRTRPVPAGEYAAVEVR